MKCGYTSFVFWFDFYDSTLKFSLLKIDSGGFDHEHTKEEGNHLFSVMRHILSHMGNFNWDLEYRHSSTLRQGNFSEVRMRALNEIEERLEIVAFRRLENPFEKGTK